MYYFQENSNVVEITKESLTFEKNLPVSWYKNWDQTAATTIKWGCSLKFRQNMSKIARMFKKWPKITYLRLNVRPRKFHGDFAKMFRLFFVWEH